MKKLFYFAFFSFFAFFGTVNCETETLNWIVDGQTYTTTTCESGGDVILPNAPIKHGYTFVGWAPQYSMIEYLESTGTQYINTGISPSTNPDLLITIDFSLYSGNLIACSFGSSQNQIMFFYNGSFACNVGANMNSNKKITTADTNKHHLVLDTRAGILSFDELPNISVAKSSISTPLFLFAKDENGEASNFAKAKIYNVSFQQMDGTYIRDFIPVLDSDGVACMYDRVSGEFFYNEGTGNFIAGPEISE